VADRTEGETGRPTLRPAQRLRRDSDVRAARFKGRKAENRWIALFVLSRIGGAQGSRFAVSVSRTLGGAVIRNRLKRFLREAWRLRRVQLRGSYDVLCVARRGAVEIRTLAVAARALDEAVRKAGMA